MPFLYKHELDAFLVQAVDQHMMDTEHTQKLEVLLTFSYIITTKCVLYDKLYLSICQNMNIDIYVCIIITVFQNLVYLFSAQLL